MDASLLLQYAVIALAVLVSAWVVMKTQFPHALRKARIAVALPLLREGRAGWLRWIGRIVAPQPRSTGSGCGGCNGCGD